MKKPTHVEAMLYWFMRHGYKATLGEILRSGEDWTYEFRARLVDAQTKFGYHWSCEKRTPRTENIYRIMPPDQGQMRFAGLLAVLFLILAGCSTFCMTDGGKAVSRRQADHLRKAGTAVHCYDDVPECDDRLSNCGKEPR